jgi:hypothetical protein
MMWGPDVHHGAWGCMVAKENILAGVQFPCPLVYGLEEASQQVCLPFLQTHVIFMGLHFISSVKESLKM